MKRLDMDVFHSEKEYYEAMFLCVRGFAEHYIRKGDNPLIAEKLYLAKSDVYRYLRETDNAINDGLQAIEYFRKSDDMSGMADACLSLSTACLMSDKPDSAQMFLSQCKSYWGSMSDTLSGHMSGWISGDSP